MSVLVYLVLLAISGLLVGALARLALPGRDPLTIFQTIAVGLAGSFGAGLVSYAFIGDPGFVGITLSILGATVDHVLRAPLARGWAARSGRARPKAPLSRLLGCPNHSCYLAALWRGR